MLEDVDVEYFLRVHDSDSIGTIGSTDVSVSCPLCREGKSWKRKHRMHLYIKPSYEHPAVHCWNCGYSSNIFGYLKEYYPNEFSSYSKAKRGKSFEELKVYKEKEEKKPEDFIPEVDFDLSSPAPIPNKEPSPLVVEAVKNLTPLPTEVKEYIINRGLDLQEHWLYSPQGNKIIFNEVELMLSEFIIIPLLKDNKWYGFQALGWKRKQFFIYLVTGNSSWKVENYFNIDKKKDVYIMESIYDRLSSGISNSISALGANLHADRLKELESPIFCLDNQNIDDKAKEETLKYLEEGYKCFIWPEGSDKFKDFNDLRKIGVPYNKIQDMINNNIYQGITGIVKLKMMR